MMTSEPVDTEVIRYARDSVEVKLIEQAGELYLYPVEKRWSGEQGALNRNKLRIVRRREESYLLRSNLTREHPARLWQYYMQLLTEIEQAFKELKSDLSSARSITRKTRVSKRTSSSLSWRIVFR